MIFCLLASSLWAEVFWSEKEKNTPLVQLPNLHPIIEQVDDTVVNVATSSVIKKDKEPSRPPDPFLEPEDFFDRFFGNPFPQQPRRTLGSGFIISKDGYIITNNHVIEGADKIEITLFSEKLKKQSGKKLNAKIVGRDPHTDIALLKVEANILLPFAYLGDSQKTKKGDWVLAFGNPFGLDHSVSLGIISAIGREITPNENRRFDDFIQTDAAINFGNSGGPLVNLSGEVIGINTAITAQGSGIGFAVPVNQAKKVISQLKAHGMVARGYLGVMIQDITDEMKEALDLEKIKGALVNDIVPNSPADKSEIKRGDVIIQIQDEPVEDAKSLQRIIADVKPGITIEMKVIRNKSPRNIKMTVGTLDKETSKPVKEEEPDHLGLRVVLIPDGLDVKISYVEPNSISELSGIQVGDVIRKINGKEIKTIADYNKEVSKLKSGQTILFDLERGKVKLFIAFRVP